MDIGGVGSVDANKVGMTKTDAAVQTLADINPDVVLEGYTLNITTIQGFETFMESLKRKIYQGLCHIRELSSNWLAKTEDAFKVGDRVDVKLIEKYRMPKFVPESSSRGKFERRSISEILPNFSTTPGAID